MRFRFTRVAVACLLAIGVAAKTAPRAHAQELVWTTWPTKYGAEPFLPPTKLGQDYYPTLLKALNSKPEHEVIMMLMTHTYVWGMGKIVNTDYQARMDAAYDEVGKDPFFSKTASMLPYAYHVVLQREGLEMVYVPRNAGPDTRAMVVIPGIGGSFMWIEKFMVDTFPDHILIFPACQVHTEDIPAEYIVESVRAAEKKLGFALRKPDLAGQSAGGQGVGRAYRLARDSFARLLDIVSCPRMEDAEKMPADADVTCICGEKDDLFRPAVCQASVDKMRARGCAARLVELPDANHFVMLESPALLAKKLREWDAGK